MIKVKKSLLQLTNAAVRRMVDIIRDQDNPNLKLRVSLIGGGCGGFKYSFALDEIVRVDDVVIEKNGITVLVDCVSFQYLSGSLLDYYEGLEGSCFTIVNPNAKTVCSCGSSFSI